MGLFKELMNAVENRLYGTGATATAKENNGVQMILITPVSRITFIAL